ncbi:MAG: L,D-transpeptidase family protein [bacterium]
MKIKKLHVVLVLLALCVCTLPFLPHLRRPVVAAIQITKGKKTISDRVGQFGTAVQKRLRPVLDQIGVEYPPKRMTLVGIKDKRLVQVWLAGKAGEWRHLKDYPILGMSGTLGPKLKEGDRQVPEGIYRVESLNPNSLYHLALRVNYPNAEDRQRGIQDGRIELGSDIMIHGKDCSIGCLAMGDEAAEDLFVLAAETGIDNVTIILSPVDFRVGDLPENMPSTPAWTKQLYSSIKRELSKLQKPTFDDTMLESPYP